MNKEHELREIVIETLLNRVSNDCITGVDGRCTEFSLLVELLKVLPKQLNSNSKPFLDSKERDYLYQVFRNTKLYTFTHTDAVNDKTN